MSGATQTTDTEGGDEVAGDPDRNAPGVRGPLDDFAEHLTAAYAPLITALSAHGIRGSIARGGTGHYLLVAASNGQHVEVTDSGRPLPAAPTDVRTWVLTGQGRTTRLPGDTPLPQVSAAIADLADG